MSFDERNEWAESVEDSGQGNVSKERRPWVAPVLTVERLEQTATTFGPSVFDGSFTS
tara:strand:+ start:144 stop:314 length:171 start_codon:yes stop_codon:yes gene_type:complete